MTEENLIIPKFLDDIVAKNSNQIALQRLRFTALETTGQPEGKEVSLTGFSYQDLQKQALKVANFLINAGLKKQEHVAIILENRPEWVIIYLGIIYAGCIAVPLDIQINSAEIKNFLLDSSSKIIFCSQEIFNKKISPDIQEILSKLVTLDAADSRNKNWISFLEIQNNPAERESLPFLEPEDIASLIYTSGTTGIPKGVLLTHKNICSNFLSIAKINLCLPSDNFISLLPLHHTYPFMVTMIVPLFLGAKITFCPLGFRPEQLGAVIKEAQVTILVGVPQLFALMHTAIFSKLNKIPFLVRFLLKPLIKSKIKLNFGKDLRLLASGGARLNPKVASDLTWLGFKIVEGYGLTEASPVVSFNPLKKIKFGSVGKPVPDVELKIDSPDEEGKGEVLIKGPNVMKGYFKQPDLTKGVIKDDWLYSGDLGYIDKEGYLFLTGRAKEVIILSSGKTIYSEELEEYYLSSPYIKEICILEKKELVFGHEVESLFAVVVPNLAYFQEKKEANIKGKIRWELENLARQLPSYKHIMGFTLSKADLPRTALRKIKRYQIREKFLEKESLKPAIEEPAFAEEDLKTLNPALARKTIHYLTNQINKPVSLDSHLEIDLGIDSLSKVELGLGLERIFSINIPDEVLYTVFTVREVIVKISEIINKVGQPEIIETKGKTWGQILKEPPKNQMLKKLRIETKIFDWCITWISKNILLFIFSIFWLLKIKGKENLPKNGPYIICPNHASFLDGFVVFSSLPIKPAINTYFLGHSAIFEHPLIRWAIKLARLIPIDPNIHLTEAMQAVSYVISHKKIVFIFPEGQRSIDEKVKEFKKGVGILLKELDILAVPVYIKGSHNSWPRSNILPCFCRLEITFGKPYRAKELLREKAGDEYDSIAQGLREEVIKLI